MNPFALYAGDKSAHAKSHETIKNKQETKIKRTRTGTPTIRTKIETERKKKSNPSVYLC